MAEIRYILAVGQAMGEEMERDPDVLLLGEDVGAPGGSFGASRGLLERFGSRRVVDTPICEASFLSLAAGAAACGLRPIVEIMFMDFITVCMDGMVNQLAKMRYMFGNQYKLPVVVRTPAGGGLNAGPQHSQCLEAWFAHVPGLKVVMPATPADAKGLLKSAIRDDNPVLVVEHKALHAMKGEVPEGEHLVPIGEARVCRQGGDVTVVTAGRMVHEALAAAAELEAEGIGLEVIDLRSIQPWDKQTVFDSVAKTHRLVVAHEAVKAFGFGAEVAAAVGEELMDELDAPIGRVGAPFMPVPFSLEQAYLPGAVQIAQAARQAAQGGF
ncbi:MAG: alpha-ketoacid dehydrogenase subunit beta [Proteobacteria bacterium]|nr:alpha-ketoacid dehydrogenase subunit beta [Pseudomonadota bacterium]MBU1452076.1 alpha-ketoacid dehydrogenase subunit beta [Pseudomonadota bacterium]MBU2467273.1 alpha-ketoacid dehydrogenase subunit beta [Pseudomonadota bacterium]MBU2517358.1 alpha-ketoacid dehydrogenase subunit beta [Pseudomonadota bacterium]